MKNIGVALVSLFLILGVTSVLAAEKCVFDESFIEQGWGPVTSELQVLSKSYTGCPLVKISDGIKVRSEIQKFSNTYLDTSKFQGLKFTKKNDEGNGQIILESLSPEENQTSYSGESGNMNRYSVDGDVVLRLAVPDDVEKVEVIWGGDMTSYPLQKFVAGSGIAKYNIKKSLGNINSGDNKYLIRAYAKGRVYEDVVLIP